MIKKILLPVIVFLTGGCALIIEVVGIRMLSPFFGNTIFTFSSVISVFLAALSFGYYAGGIIADKKPSFKLFFTIIFLSGIAVLITQLISVIFLPEIGYKLSMKNGPLIVSFILFLIPGLTLGTISPFAIKLQKKLLPKKGIGKAAGEIFFWSTFGSIFGSLTTGFLLIPSIGINIIVLGTGIFLIFLGLIPLLILRIAGRVFISFLIFSFILILMSYSSLVWSLKTNALYQKDGVYEKLTIFDIKYKGKTARILFQDKSTSGGIYFDSGELVFDYTKYYELYKLFNPNLKEALVIGGGAYIIPKALIENTSSNVDVVEIEPVLFELSKKYFKLPDSPKLKNHIKDGRRFLHASNKKYDYIFSDAYLSLYSIPSHLVTEDFFITAKNKMNKDAVFLANFIGNLSPKSPSLILSSIKTFKKVFPNSYFFATESPESMKNQNIIFLGINGDKEINFAKQNILNNKNKFLKELPGKFIKIDEFDFSKHLIFTDNFAPTDYYTSKLF